MVEVGFFCRLVLVPGVKWRGGVGAIGLRARITSLSLGAAPLGLLCGPHYLCLADSYTTSLSVHLGKRAKINYLMKPCRAKALIVVFLAPAVCQLRLLGFVAAKGP